MNCLILHDNIFICAGNLLYTFMPI